MFNKKKKKPMVKYWMTKDAVEAKVYVAPEGHLEMMMEGEDYPFPGYPRGHLLFGSLSPLKHWVKNKIFNDAWKMLEDKVDEKQILSHLKDKALPEIFELTEKSKYDMVPYERMVPPVKEVWRAMSVVEEKTGSEKCRKLKELITFVLQEDDAYRFRFQWMCKFIKSMIWWRKPTIKDFYFALAMLEHGEVIGDMKERQVLFRRILMFVLNDPDVRKCFELLLKEMDWKKLRLSKADKYHFRAKYFKVDYPEDEY